MKEYGFAPLKKHGRQYGHEYAMQVQMPNSGNRNQFKTMTTMHSHIKEK